LPLSVCWDYRYVTYWKKAAIATEYINTVTQQKIKQVLQYMDWIQLVLDKKPMDWC